MSDPLLDVIVKLGEQVMAALDDFNTAVQKLSDGVQSLIAVANALKDKETAAAQTNAVLAAAAGTVNSMADAVNAAVTRDTPAP